MILTQVSKHGEILHLSLSSSMMMNSAKGDFKKKKKFTEILNAILHHIPAEKFFFFLFKLPIKFNWW
jgi:hypothetical protein